MSMGSEAIESWKRIGDLLSKQQSDSNDAKADHHIFEHVIGLVDNFKRQLTHKPNNTPDDNKPDNKSGENHRLNSLAYRYGRKMSDMLDSIGIGSGCTQPEVSAADQLLGWPQERKHLQAVLCFCLFEQGYDMKMRDLAHWWVAQQLIQGDKDADKAADVFLTEIMTGSPGIIERVVKGRKRESHSFRMHPDIRAIIREQHLGIPKLLQQQINDEEKKSGTINGVLHLHPKDNVLLNVIDLGETTIDKKMGGDVVALFNSGMSTPDINKDWLRNTKRLEVLHLGRCGRDPSVHMEDINFLTALKGNKHVRFLSLKGVSGIMKLPGEICSLGSLRVLEMRACPNLEVLPQRIGKLKNLTHLDLSDCYLLEYVPSSITSLKHLQVLEGFVISDVDNGLSCTFKDMANHIGKTLRKLSINTRKMDFPTKEDLTAFAGLKELLKLKITWVRVSSPKQGDESLLLSAKPESKDVGFRAKTLIRSLTRTGEAEAVAGLPRQLEKLEVQAIPRSAVKSLLLENHEVVRNLKKLYIIGGELSELRPSQEEVKWEKVESMKLKYLTKLHMNWRQFKAIFPSVAFLEMTQCPRLAFFPCDQYGVWRL